ncbi:hypothetical protein [Microvirga sp. VF16]|uniref:hypothetical protein n=1 Tax=Microvirga sp. VF16 TaxID=2807101 RepID=UPI00193CEACD|nr:hypothetical protein [Microvirga sp. VF16]QRM35302.1 hypothetical protein JO965_40805 [Microvirga sp. VF16]
MNNTDQTKHSRPVRGRLSRSMLARWGMILALLTVAVVFLFAGPETGGGSWPTGGTGLILLLFLLPCLLMPFLMGRRHSGTSERKNSDDRTDG